MQIHCNQVNGDPDALLSSISYQINNKPRAAKGGLTPVQLLQLNNKQVKQVNGKYKFRNPLAMDNQPDLRVGDRVRVLLIDRKDQQGEKVKGFSEKWSKEIYTVLRKTSVRRNHNFKKYHLSDGAHSRFRHELLKIPDKLDTVVPKLRGLRSSVFEGPRSRNALYKLEEDQGT